MEIIINNQSYQLDERASLQQALEALNMEDVSGIAVAVNEELVPRSMWKETALSHRDQVIVIGAVAGG
jgi:sulfur carrier protein